MCAVLPRGHTLGTSCWSSADRRPIAHIPLEGAYNSVTAPSSCCQQVCNFSQVGYEVRVLCSPLLAFASSKNAKLYPSVALIHKMPHVSAAWSPSVTPHLPKIKSKPLYLDTWGRCVPGIVLGAWETKIDKTYFLPSSKGIPTQADLQGIQWKCIVLWNWKFQAVDLGIAGSSSHRVQGLVFFPISQLYFPLTWLVSWVRPSPIGKWPQFFPWRGFQVAPSLCPPKFVFRKKKDSFF